MADAVAAFHDKLRGTTTKYWAPMRAFGSLCRLASGPDEWEVVALAALGIAFGLRVKEAVSAHYDGSVVRWQGAKGRSGACEEVPGPRTAKWAQLLWDIRARHGYHPERPAWHPTRHNVHKALKDIVSRLNLGCSPLRWHSWRRLGGAQLRCLGAPTDTQLCWGGGWATAGCYASMPTKPTNGSSYAGGRSSSLRRTAGPSAGGSRRGQRTKYWRRGYEQTSRGHTRPRHASRTSAWARLPGAQPLA